MKSAPPQPGSRFGNFLIQQSRQLTDLNLMAITLRHEPTGARLLHLACNDPNNVFAIGFRTPPPDSTGIAHILEHTVLCGSKKFPVRDPFFAMLKRSLNTFMNALTAADWTLYPVASTNRRDFYNLMGIYLDATFFPLLREQDFIQEGHRLDFADPEDLSSLMIKGVVFNEMKGAMADPSSLLGRRLNALLFPDNCYGRNSGGEPLIIPKLTWGQLRAFHKTYYHPSNSWIFTYGNLPLEDNLQQIEELALSHFVKQVVESAIPLQPRFSSPRRHTETFPIERNEELSHRSMVQVAWLTCPIEETYERAATGILVNLLLGNPAAPLYQALVESGLGQTLSPGTGYHDDYRDTFISAGLQGTDPEKQTQIEDLILTTLSKVADQGFPGERIEAALHQYEFANREVTGDQFPYGLGLMMRLFGPWLHAGDALSTLMIKENLSHLRNRAKDPKFFPNLIHQYLLDNPHRVTLLLQPDYEHNRREEQSFEEYLEQVTKQLDNKAIAEIKSKSEALQKSQDSPEDTSCLPMLELSDIELEEQTVSFETDNLHDCKCYWFPQPTNGITYLNIHFELNPLDEDLLPYLPIFCALLPQIGAAQHDYLEMSRRITSATGGIRFGTTLLENPFNLDEIHPVVELRGKSLDDRQESLCGIVKDILTSPNFNDLERLATVIGQVRTSMENSIPSAGHSFAARAAAASLTPSALLREQWGGMSQTQLMRSINRIDEEGLNELANKFSAIAAEIFTAQRATVAVVAEQSAFHGISAPLKSLLSTLPEASQKNKVETKRFEIKSTHTGWQYNLPVAYVAQVFRTVPYAHPDAPALMVLAKLLRAEFLHREIREKGGAYGGMAGYNADGGLFSMLSYRDPHLERTIDVYRQAVQWACKGQFSDEVVKQSILTAFAELDRPLSPKSRGYREFIHQQQGLSHEKIRAFRNGVIQTDKTKLINVAKIYLGQAKQTSSVGILAGDETYQKASKFLEEISMNLRRLE